METATIIRRSQFGRTPSVPGRGASCISVRGRFDRVVSSLLGPTPVSALFLFGQQNEEPTLHVTEPHG